MYLLYLFTTTNSLVIFTYYISTFYDYYKFISTFHWTYISLWSRGALTVLPQPQLQGASGMVLPVRFELLVSHSLS